MTPELQRKLEDAAVAAGIQLSLITQAKRYLRQLAPQAAEREGALLICQLVLKLQDAERMAAAVDDMVRRSALDARSLLADARLDYGKPFSESTVQEILSTRPEALPIDDVGAVAWAYRKLKAFGAHTGTIDSAMMMDRLNAILTTESPGTQASSVGAVPAPSAPSPQRLFTATDVEQQLQDGLKRIVDKKE